MVLQELKSTAPAATVMRRNDFIGIFDTAYPCPCKWILKTLLKFPGRVLGQDPGGISASKGEVAKSDGATTFSSIGIFPMSPYRSAMIFFTFGSSSL